MYVPFTGLGLYNGFRGDNWLRNRIQIFKQFVLPSLKSQTSQNFILWISWRREERNNPIVQEFIDELHNQFFFYRHPGKLVNTFSGVCFYDDKYPDDVARDRLATSIHGALPELIGVINECDYVLMTIQPSDDLYCKDAVGGIQKIFENNPDIQGIGFPNGYICNYNTKEISEYNPQTNPPFYTIKFPKHDFIDPLRHCNFTALKKDVGRYKKGTPCPSHEYVPDCVQYAVINNVRGFLVGTHGVNISTTFTNPYKGRTVDQAVMKEFGIYDVDAIKIKISLGKRIMLKLPFKVQRKLRYWFSEKLKI